MVTNQGRKLTMTAIIAPAARPRPRAAFFEIVALLAAKLNNANKQRVPNGKLKAVCDQAVSVVSEYDCIP